MMWNHIPFWLFQFLVAILVSIENGVWGSQNDNNNPIVQMEREINKMTLSQRLSNIETEYAQRLSALEAKMDLILADRVNSNKALDMVTDVMKLIIEIQKQNDQLKTNVQVLKNEIQTDKANKSQIITSMNQTIMSQVQGLSSFAEDYNTDVRDLNSKFDLINATLRNHLLNISEHVAFSVSLSHDITNSEKHYKVVFDTIITNIGNGYSSNTGVFTVPLDGLYIFHWTILTLPGTVFDTELVVNGVPKRGNAADAGGGKSWNSGSSMVTVLLNKNDKVWIRKWLNGGNRIHGNFWPGFSGFRLA